jgi:hypothetical protein
MSSTSTLVRYDAMCTAIAECHKVDEVKDLRDKAKAIEVYAKQAQNLEAERQAAEIRIRAERRAGELLREMKEQGLRASSQGNLKQQVPKFQNRTSDVACQPTLADLGVTKKQSHQWQALAAVPEAEFERVVRGEGPKPSTEGIINAASLGENPAPRMDPDALWFWGRLRDFERNGIFGRKVAELVGMMTDSMRDDCIRILPSLRAWLNEQETTWNRQPNN